MMSTYPVKAETLLRNASIITMDPRRPRAEAVAILNGKFISVGSAAELTNLVGPNTRVLDLTGKTVLPGFIDAHIHVLNSGIRHVMAADCDLRSIGDIQTALRERVSPLLPPGNGCRASSSTTPRPTKTDSCSEKTWTRSASIIPSWWPTGPATFTT